MVETLHRLEGPGDRKLMVRLQGDPIYHILASKGELAVCSAGDTPEPVITIMLPDED